MDGDGDVVLVRTGAEATDSTAVSRDEIEEVVAATPPLRRQAREIGPLLDVEQIRRLVDGWGSSASSARLEGGRAKITHTGGSADRGRQTNLTAGQEVEFTGGFPPNLGLCVLRLQIQ